MRKNLDVQKLVLTSILASMVLVLHLISFITKIGIFQFQLALIPIIISSILLGPKTGGLLGFISALFILLSGEAATFWGMFPLGTVITVIVKGVCCGIVPGIKYRVMKKNQNLAVVASSISAPCVNTGLFVLGCIIFFLPGIKEKYDAGIGFIFTGFIGINFFIEVAIVSILSPAIIKILKLSKLTFKED